MTVFMLHEKISEFCPRSLSCSWDNDGIMVSGDTEAEVKRVLVALDATMNVIDYAVKCGADTIVTHHPMIFRGMKSVSGETLCGAKTVKIIKNGISVLSFHTRLDAADGGVNDTLCRTLGFEACGKFGDEEAHDLGRIADIHKNMSAGEFASLVREKLGCRAVRVSGDLSRTVKRAAFCGGDGKSLVYPALYAGCDVFVTGDAGYNMASDAAEEGLITIEAGHYHTEAPICRILAELVEKICGAECEIFDSCAYEMI